MTKTILITGASSGLGRDTALAFAGRGWNVAATMRKPDVALAAEQPQMLVQALDVTDPMSVGAAIEATVARFGGIDAVVNNAGVSFLSLFEPSSDADMRRVFETNYFGPLNVIRAALQALKVSRGVIVNVTSGVGFMATPLLSHYVASKHALEGVSESLHYELESQGVRIRLVEPGAMRNTAFTANTMGASQGAAVPDHYRAYFDAALGAMMNYPFAPTNEAEVVAAIEAAVADTTYRLRYPVGPDVIEYARLRWSTSEDEYLSQMRRLNGQEAWVTRA
jgi:NAD(P)-dependent dehydrogenase (short-subunit alcohol dehydrogenase family)